MYLSIALPRFGAAPLAGLAALAFAFVSLMWTPGDLPLPAVHLLSIAAAFYVGRTWPWLAPWAVAGYLTFTSALWLCWMFLGILNPNFIGCLVAFGIACAVAAELWFWLIVLGPMLYLTASRGAIIAAGLVALAALWRWSKFTALGTTLVVVLIALTNRSVDSSLLTRLGVWQDTLNHLTLWGTGWGSFLADYTTWPVHRNMTLILAPHAYNDALEVVHDLGIGAVLVWLWLALSLRDAPASTRMVALGFFACGLSYFPLWLPLMSQTFALLLGYASTHERTLP